jgi:hypothetical protein
MKVNLLMQVNDVSLTAENITLTKAFETMHTTLRFTDIDKESKIGVSLSGTDRNSDNYWRLGSGTHNNFYEMVEEINDTLTTSPGWPIWLKIPKRFIKKWELNEA